MRIKDHLQFTDEEYERQFKTFQLKPGMFSHEAHLRLAYIHIQRYGVAQAELNMCEQIKGYAESLGFFDKFNKTITIASVKTMDHFMSKSTTDNFHDFIQAFPQLLTDFKGIIRQHYGFNVFADKRAKQEYVAPDLLPF